MVVVVKLEPLSKQAELLKFLRNEDCAGFSNGFVQNIALTVGDHQVCGRKHNPRLLITSLQQDTYENTKGIHEVARNINQITEDIHEMLFIR
jgi:hypothetical protein